MARRNAPDNALVVRTFSYPTTTVGSGPDDTGVRPLAGCTVTITQGPGPSLPTPQPLPSPKVTGADGEVRFENLPEGTSANPYRINVTQPAGFQPPPARPLFVNGRGPFSFAHNLPVKEGGEVVAAVVLAPDAGRVAGTVQVTMPPPAAPATPAGIRVEARNGGLLVDSDQTDSAGAYQLAIDRPGLIEIIPQPEVQVGNLTFNPQPGDASQFVLVRAGDTSVQANITYVASGAQILVGAQLVEQVDGEEKRSTLDGVKFRLFEQGKPDPLRELITQQQTSGAFSDLPAGAYRIEALAPDASNGQRLQLTRPSTPALSIRVGDGQHIDLAKEFEFQPTRGSVIGSVVVARDDRPVPGVAVVVSSQQEPQLVRRVVTDADGAYGVDELPPGRYRVALERTAVAAFGTSFELAGEGDPGRTIEVKPHATSVVDEFRLVEDEHLISGSVVRPDGTGAAFVTVQFFDDLSPAAAAIGTVLTDQYGNYQFRAPRAGTFFAEVLAPGGVAPQRMPVSVNRPTTAPPLPLPGGPPIVGGGSTGGAGTTSQPSGLQDLNDFPFLTEEVDLSGGLGPAPPAGDVGAVGQTVERTLREVLGWRPRASDPKGFQAALMRAFTAKEVAGHTEYSWNPRSYAVEIQADLGAVTGAQASLYTRAKNAVDQALPLVEGLKPLRVDFDPENVNAIRAIVQTQLTELVAEIGVEGGPRVQRVDQLFGFLLGDQPFDDLNVLRDPDQVEGSLGDLSGRLGLERKRINTIEEEQNFTNLLVVVDHVVSLAESWDAQRKFFAREGVEEPFLGTQLVLLSRDLEVVAESVREVEFAMNSVFLGPNERQTLELQFPSGPQTGTGQQAGAPTAAGTPPMFVSELLSWVERFATDEGRKLIDEGGRLGVVAFRPTIQLLETLVRAALVPPQDPNRMPAAYRRQRVQRALRELADQLKNTAARVELIRPPVDDGPDGQAPATPVTQPTASQPRRRRRRRPPAPSNGQTPPPDIT
jgi:Carboxypeptidase regulatory-like domain